MRKTAKSGRMIAILEENSIYFVAILLGIIRSGNVFVLINPTLSEEQIKFSLKKIGCDYYAASKQKSYLNFDMFINVDDIELFFNSTVDERYFQQTDLTENAGVIFSSGTTGEPKALLRNSYSILSEAIQWIIELQLIIGTTFLIPRPLYYTGGFVLLYAALFSGGRIDLIDDISSKGILSYLSNNPVDWAFIVPEMIRELIREDESSALLAKNVLTMGSPIYYADKTMFQSKFGCNLIEVWGNSEGLATITHANDLFSKPESIGRPFFADYLDIKQDGQNADGIIYGMSDNEFTEYIGNPELTKEILHEGYIFSEDIGRKDEDGYFYLTGRIKDIIVIDGIKVFPSDIEKILIGQDGVKDCVIFSVENDMGNDEIAAAVVLSDSMNSISNIVNNMNIQLAPHEKIKYCIEVNNIPRNHGGKPDKMTLQKYFCSKLGSDLP